MWVEYSELQQSADSINSGPNARRLPRHATASDQHALRPLTVLAPKGLGDAAGAPKPPKPPAAGRAPNALLAPKAGVDAAAPNAGWVSTQGERDASSAGKGSHHQRPRHATPGVGLVSCTRHTRRPHLGCAKAACRRAKRGCLVEQREVGGCAPSNYRAQAACCRQTASNAVFDGHVCGPTARHQAASAASATSDPLHGFRGVSHHRWATAVKLAQLRTWPKPPPPKGDDAAAGAPKAGWLCCCPKPGVP